MERHTLISRELLPRQLALQFFQTLLKTSPLELATAIDWVQEATIKLSLSDCAKDLAGFAQKKNIVISTPEAVLEALFSLEGLRCSLEWSGTAVLQFLLDDARKAKVIPENFDENQFRQLIDRFFTNAPKLERTLKAQRIYDGLLPNYESCSSVVDFRPVYDEARDIIVNGIIAATLIIEAREVEPDQEVQKYAFQVDAADVEQLLEELSRIKKKLKVLKELAERHTQLLNPSRSLKVEDGR
jgi:hypothetical protein